MRHPWWWKEAKLAFVSTYFFLLPFLLFIHFEDSRESDFFMGPHNLTKKYVKKLIFLSILTFFYESFLDQGSVAEAWTNPSPWSIFYVFCFSPIRGYSPSYFGITRRNINNKKLLQKLIFGCFFWSFRPAFGRGSLDQP